MRLRVFLFTVENKKVIHNDKSNSDILTALLLTKTISSIYIYDKKKKSLS